MSNRLPALFLGHGNPMNALESNAVTRAWAELGAGLPRARAILAISAHWYVEGVRATAMAAPRTIHDFGGFPRALFEVSYPAPGDPGLAARVAELLASAPVALDESWGLDHGTWSLLVHLYPEADVPVVQLSIDVARPPEEHLELGRRLAPLRDEGVLVLGSGNLVHNLARYDWSRARSGAYDWAERFEAWARDRIEAGDLAALCDTAAFGEDGRLAVPTLEHYLPLLYVLGASEGERSSYPVEGFDGGSISMLAVQRS